MVDSILLHEGIHVSNMLPIAYFRPVYDLRCGILTLREKVEAYYPGVPVSLNCRDYLMEVVKQKNPDSPFRLVPGSSCLVLNGQTIVDKDFVDQIDVDGPDTLYTYEDACIAAKVSGENFERLQAALQENFCFKDLDHLPKKKIKANYAFYIWDLVNRNGTEIEKDFALLAPAAPTERQKGKVYDGVFMVNRDQIYIGEGAKIKPGVVLDAEEGPIYIDEGATIFPNAVIEGPAFIGKKSKIKVGAKIYEGTSIGEVCKVGGEVEESIIHSYANKQHDGFLGHAYLGMWVNLGADTNNSDLKNNYGNIKVFVNGKQMDSGSMFVGLTMGDHSKTGINTMFNTGTVVGVCSNIFGAGFPNKYVPSFTWGGSDDSVTYDLEKCFEVMERVMERRDIELTDTERELTKQIFALTEKEREEFGVK